MSPIKLLQLGCVGSNTGAVVAVVVAAAVVGVEVWLRIKNNA